MASPALLWECVKKNSSFIRKSPLIGVPVMNAEPGNLCGLNSFKFSGLANKQVLDVTSVTKGKKESVVVTKRHPKASRAARPESCLIKTGINKQCKKGSAAIAKLPTGSFYRRDLAGLAAVKYAKVLKTFKKKKLTVKSRRAGK